MNKRFDKEEDKKYQKVYGAVAWPGKRPGFAVIIGQKREFRLGGYDLVFLDELEEGDTRKLVRSCGAFNYFFRPEKWFGDTKNEAGDKFIREMNKSYDSSREKILEGWKNFVLRPSPIFDMKNAFSYFYPMLKELLRKDRRRLFVKESKLLGYLLQPQERDLQDIDWGDFPAIEALAFCVLELEQEAKRGAKVRQKKALNDYERI